MLNWFRRNFVNIAIAGIVAVPICIMAHIERSERVYTPVVDYEEPIYLETETESIVIIGVEDTTFTTQSIETESEPEIEYISLGEFKITAYCSCKKCCGKWADKRPLDENGNPIVYGASGEVLIPKYSVAVDPDIIPYGTKLYFNGNEYIAHDCGGGIDGKDLDLYFDSHDEAREWGVKRYEVFIIKEN